MTYQTDMHDDLAPAILAAEEELASLICMIRELDEDGRRAVLTSIHLHVASLLNAENPR